MRKSRFLSTLFKVLLVTLIVLQTVGTSIPLVNAEELENPDADLQTQELSDKATQQESSEEKLNSDKQSDSSVDVDKQKGDYSRLQTM